MEGLKYFEEIASTLPNPEIDKWKSQGRRVIGTVCSDIPEEVIHAAGMLPLRVRAPKLEGHIHGRRAPAHCSIALIPDLSSRLSCAATWTTSTDS